MLRTLDLGRFGIHDVARVFTRPNVLTHWPSEPHLLLYIINLQKPYSFASTGGLHMKMYSYDPRAVRVHEFFEPAYSACDSVFSR